MIETIELKTLTSRHDKYRLSHNPIALNNDDKRFYIVEFEVEKLFPGKKLLGK